MNTTIKKQNRILLAALVVILAAAAILVAVTGGANKKEKNENLPAETDVVEEKRDSAKSSKEKEQSAAKEQALESSEDISAEKKNAEKDAVKEDSAEADAGDEEVASVQSMSDTLPTFAVPVDNFVLKSYSADIPVFSYTMNDYRTHNGIDIACSAGTPVMSAADGFVCEVSNDPMMGVTVGIQHSGGAVTRYMGLSEDSMNLVKTGDEVKRGQVIGASGDTALIESAEEGHVHFELTVNGESKDPGEYMKLMYLADVHEG